MSANRAVDRSGLLASFTTLPGTIGESKGAALRATRGEDGGIAGSSKVDLRKKSCLVDCFSGVVPMTSRAGDAPFCQTFLWLLRNTVDGASGPALDGGMMSSVEGRGMSADSSDFGAITSLKRWLTGVAFT